MFDLAVHTANHAPHIMVLIVFVLVFGPPAILWCVYRNAELPDAPHTATCDDDDE